MEKTQTKKSQAPKIGSMAKSIHSLFPLFGKNYTYVSTDMSILGDIDAEKNLVIDGKMSGNIRSAKHVSLGPTSHFEGGINCQSATISGYVKGCIKASQSLVVKTPATIIGDLISASVQVEPGVVLRGKIFSDPQEHTDKMIAPYWKPAETVFPVEPVES